MAEGTDEHSNDRQSAQSTSGRFRTAASRSAVAGVLLADTKTTGGNEDGDEHTERIEAEGEARVEQAADEKRRPSGTGPRTRLREYVTNSRLAAVHSSLSRASSRLEASAANSWVASIGATGKGYVEASYCYRWLTTEPDPDIIVIDLRETWTVGPIIRVMDRVIGQLETALGTSAVARRGQQLWTVIRARPIRVASLVVLPAVTASLLLSLVVGSAVSGAAVVGHLLVAGLAAAGTRSRRSLDELLETHVGQLLLEAFEPPTPPASVECERDDRRTDRAEDD